MKILFVEAKETLYMPVMKKMPKRWTYLIEIATYIKQKGHEVKVIDCIDPRLAHGEVLQEICENKYDVICFLVRTETLESLIKLVPIIKKMSPKSKLIAYGDAISMYKNFIINNIIGLDAIVGEGDWELIIENYLNYIKTNDKSKLSGITIKEKGKFKKYIQYENTFFNNWCFPDLNDDLGNKELYLSLRHNELTFSISRGCPFNCKFCMASKTFNKRDRRKDIKEIVKYMEENKNKVGSYKLFSPTFTINREWVKQLSQLLIKQNVNKPWVITSRIDCLDDEEMLKLMKKAGCQKISVGIETLDEESRKEINKLNNIKDYKKTIKTVFDMANRNGIEIKPLLMCGIKGQSLKSMNKTIEFLKECGAKTYRISAYSPRQLLTEKDSKNELTLKKILSMDKMTYINYLPEEMDEETFYRMIYRKEGT